MYYKYYGSTVFITYKLRICKFEIMKIFLVYVIYESLTHFV